jgi:hypothetical protein
LCFFLCVRAPATVARHRGRSIAKKKANQKNSPPLPFSIHPADSITCSLLGAGLQSGPCGSLSGTFKSYASRFASADCDTVRRASADLGGLPEPSDACCSQLRQFAANGCACDSVTSSLASAFLGGGGDTAAAIKGGVKLAQASRCSSPKLGGPIVDACDGSTGCPMKA